MQDNNLGCEETIYTNCIKYEGPVGTCIPIITGESLSTVFPKIDSAVCERENNSDKYVTTSIMDGVPDYLLNKLQNDPTIIWSVQDDCGELKVRADVDIDYIVEQIIADSDLLYFLCYGCAEASTTTSTTSSTTTIPLITTTSTSTSTTTLPNNIEVHNNVFNSSITSVTGTTGFSLSNPVNKAELVSGRHNSFNTAISVTITGLFVPSHLTLRKNGIDIECINVTTAGVYTFQIVPFIIADLCTIELAETLCATTSTTTIPPTTTTSTSTTSTTTLPNNVLIVNNLTDSSITDVVNLTGFNLVGFVNFLGFQYGNHTGFTGSIQVDLDGIPVSGSISLFVNGTLIQCIDVFGIGTFIFNNFTFLSSDFITIQANDNICTVPTTTTTIPTSTTSTTTSTTSTTTSTTSTTTSTTSTSTTSTTTIALECCPPSFTLTPDNLSCFDEDVQPADSTGAGLTVCHFTSPANYGNYGVVIYKAGKYNIDGTWNGADPTAKPENISLGTGLGYNASAFNTTVITAPHVWLNSDFVSAVDSRLNRGGLWRCGDQNYGATPLGFSRQVTAPVTKLYYIGIGSDNYATIDVNGTTVLNQDVIALASPSYFNAGNWSFRFWHLYPVTLNAGPNIISMTATNTGSIGIMGFEIYDATEGQLMAVTTDAALTPYILFSTEDIIDGSDSDIGNYNCSSNPGYSLVYDPGTDTYSCILITTTPKIAC